MDKEDMVYIHYGILLSHKKEQNNAICSNMDATRDYHTKWNRSEKERQIPCDFTYMRKITYGINKLTYKAETDSQTQRAESWLLGGGEVGRGGLGV